MIQRINILNKKETEWFKNKKSWIRQSKTFFVLEGNTKT